MKKRCGQVLGHIPCGGQCFSPLILMHLFEEVEKIVNDQRNLVNMSSGREFPGAFKDKQLRCFFLNELQRHAGVGKQDPILLFSP